MTGTKKNIGLALLVGMSLLGSASGTSLAQDLHPGPPPMERAFHGGMMHGRWWNDPKMAQQVGLSADQQKKMDDILQQNRLKLIDLDAALKKQEVAMQPLMEADQPNEGRILAQIDAIAQARAELEKNNARMLLEIRQTMTPDQWKKLKALREEGPRNWRGHDGRDGRSPGGPPLDGGQSGPSQQME